MSEPIHLAKCYIIYDFMLQNIAVLYLLLYVYVCGVKDNA